MREIDIQISKAKIQSVHIIFKEDLPQISVCIGLYTSSAMKISEYSIDTHAWDENRRFEVPPDIIAPILRITDSLEKIVAAHCQSSQKILAVPHGN